MNRLSALVAVLAMIAGQAGATVVPARDVAPAKVTMAACTDPAKANKVAKPALRANSCATRARPFHFGTVPVVFTAAAITGVIVVGVGTRHDNNPASP